MTIVNPMPEEEMAEVLGSPGSGFAKQGLGWVTSGGGGSGDGKVLLLHVSGDSTAHATLEKLIAEPDTVRKQIENNSNKIENKNKTT